MMLPKTLTEFFELERVKSGQLSFDKDVINSTVVVFIDAQKKYADPNYPGNGKMQANNGVDKGPASAKSDAVCKKIATLAPMFRRANLQIIWVYKYREGFEENDPETARGGFHRVEPCAGDIVIAKASDSMMNDTELEAVLQNRNAKKIICAGGFISDCFSSSVFSALRSDYEVCAMNDLTFDKRYYEAARTEKSRDRMVKEGAVLSDSSQVLQVISEYSKLD